jgi:hypothetical protein
MNLGDQFGLSLYNRGSVNPLVGFVLGSDPAKVLDDGTVWRPTAEEQKDAGDVDQHIDHQLAEEKHEAPVPQGDPPDPAGQAPDFDAEKFLADLTEKALNIPESVKRPRAHLLSLQLDASKHDLLDALTYDGNGEAVPFKLLIEQRIKAVA